MSFPRNAAKGEVRAFIAVLLGQGQLARLAGLQRVLGEKLPRDLVRWLQPGQLHLTLRFLGNVPEEKTAGLTKALEQAVAGLAAFSLAFEGIGCFPSLRRPNVIWVGLAGELEALQALQGRVEAASGPFSSHSEVRRFHPHLTVGRIRPGTRGLERIGPVVENFSWQSAEGWLVQTVHLMKSVLHPTGAVYTSVASVVLPLRA